MAACNTSLLPLRQMLFAFYGAIGCVVPFVRLHMDRLGLTADQQGWVECVAPLACCVVPLLGAAVSDRLGNYRPLLVLALLLGAAVYPCLLLVPLVRRLPPRPPAVALHCGARGAIVHAELCGEACVSGDRSTQRAYYITDCQYRCEEEPPADTPPHLCLEGEDTRTLCEVVSDDGGLLLNASLSLLPADAGGDAGGEGDCQYPLVGFSRGGARHRSLTCGRRADCQLHCGLQQLDEAPLFPEDMCRAVLGRPERTLWLYLAVRAGAEACLSLALALVSASTLVARRRHGTDHGREVLWGLLGLAVTAPVTGALLETAGTGLRGDLRPGLCLYAALLLSALLLAALATVRPGARGQPSARRQLSAGAPELLGAVCALTALGALWGCLQTLVSGRAAAVSPLQAGLGTAAGLLLLLPLMCRAETLISYCGHHHVLMVAFVGYIVRYVSYAYVAGPWLQLAVDSLAMFTVHLAWLSAVQLSSRLGRPAVEATLQALITAAHFGVGRAVGAGVVRYVLPLVSEFVLLCAGSVLSACCAALYLLLYHCCRTLTARRPPAKRTHHHSDGAMLNGSVDAARPGRW